jgi:translation initiation factor IF-2
MTNTTVAEFAKELKKSPDTLLEQLKSAGVPKGSASDELTDADKQKLLGFLKASHGTDTPERKKITLVNCKGTVKSVLDIANFGKIFEIR